MKKLLSVLLVLVFIPASCQQSENRNNSRTSLSQTELEPVEEKVLLKMLADTRCYVAIIEILRQPVAAPNLFPTHF